MLADGGPEARPIDVVQDPNSIAGEVSAQAKSGHECIESGLARRLPRSRSVKA
jgi:hypothetical protein